MTAFWMIRAGEGGSVIEDFERAGCVAIGWGADFSSVRSIDEMKVLMEKSEAHKKPQARALAASMVWKFRNVMQKGDRVVSYDPARREYLLGTITGDYQYKPDVVPRYKSIRKVHWQGRVSRDALRPTSRNSLGALATVFEPGEEVLADLDTALSRGPAAQADRPELPTNQPDADLDFVRRDTVERAKEFIKDKILALSPDDMEELTASLLRAMGYKARVTPTGPDRGRDVIASRDGLGLEHPRIVAEVKHRPREAMGAPAIRSFVGGLREGDRGLYVSVGGFSREARYEAERSNIPVALVDLDELAALVVEHYERFDSDGRALIPLVKVYWPAS
jgi:restriction system protein